MGRLWSYNPECQGHQVNGVILGQPVDIDGDPTTYEWDDSALPNGRCDLLDGQLVITVDDPTPTDN